MAGRFMIMMLSAVLTAVAPLSAQPADAPKARTWESNFGQVILANSDVIVLGVAAAKRSQVAGATAVEITVQDVVSGEEKAATITVVLSDPGVLKKDAAVEGLFALRRMAGSGYRLVGKPEEAPSGDRERDLKLAVTREFIALEKLDEGEARTEAFLSLVQAHLQRETHAAQNAGLELKLWVRRKPELISREIFNRFVRAHEELARGPAKARNDVFWAVTWMVELKIKGEEFRNARRGKTAAEKTQAVDALTGLRETYPEAFDEADARLCEGLAKDEGFNASQAGKLTDLAAAIRAELRRREEARRAETRPVTETREVPSAEARPPAPKVMPGGR